MSTDLYHRRLAYYAGRGGIAKEGNLVLQLSAPPPIFIGITEIDYGEVCPGQLLFTPFVRQADHARRRDLMPFEIAMVRTWLGSLLQATLDAAAKPPVPVERRA